jgi:hypothetical protein
MWLVPVVLIIDQSGWGSLEDRNRVLIHREIEGFKLLISLSTGYLG